MMKSDKTDGGALRRYLTPLGAWALAFGCSVGWGAFVMPGTTFLPLAGPTGTAIGIFVGALVMLVIGMNYHYLINRYSEPGGTYAFTRELFGYDHGFLNAWFMLLTYIAIIWANATALPLIARNLLGETFQVGGFYEIAGYRVYMGESLVAVAALLAAGLACLKNRRAMMIQIIMALTLCVGVLTGIAAALFNPQPGVQVFNPPFAPKTSPITGVFTVIALAPWAYVGFESISHSAAEFRFSAKKSFAVMAAAVLTAAVAYAALAILSVTALPEGFSSWPDYIGGLGGLSGIESLPTFFCAERLLGGMGKWMVGLTTLGAIVTGLVGNAIAASRLMVGMAEDDMLPKWFGRLNAGRAPRNAIVFIVAVSLPLPFMGRTAISWIVDVTTVGATIAYAYVSAAALKTARRENDKRMIGFGTAGLIFSMVFVLFFLVPNLMSVNTLSTESYLILAAWGILGIVFFLFLLLRDRNRRLGRSTIVWVVLLALIIFTSTVWMRQATRNATEEAVKPIQEFYTEKLREANVDIVSTATRPVESYLEDQLEEIGHVLTETSLIQTVLIVVSLAILFYIYYLMQKRERQVEVEKALAEESSRAKTSFLSNMSHEIRTPMNAIIGLDNIALRDPNLPPQTREQLEKIGASAKHLLALINDILDMSRIESGRMSLKESEFAFREFLDQINVMIHGQCADKGLDYECRISGHMDDYYIGDSMKLKQVIINILGNAVKFTNAPGSVTFTVEQSARFEGHRTLRFVMKDTGIGMSREYLPKIFEAFSQEDDHVANKYGSTGLGMAITKNIVEMMNGEITVDSEKGVGTTFVVTVTLKASSRSVDSDGADVLPRSLRTLVLDDDRVAAEHAQLVCGAVGIQADICEDPRQALRLMKEALDSPNPYQLVLTDYRMPDMDGVAFTRALREMDHGTTTVIILTGYSYDDMQDDAMAAGADGIMSKPLFTDSLRQGIRAALLRREGERPASQEAQQSAPEGILAGLRVLIAEDMEINAEILADLLELEDMTSDHAENGQVAVNMFADHPQGYYDAVLMDVRMPVMDGLAAARGIRELKRPDAATVPIIAMTANAFDEDVQRSLQAGMNAHLSKPVEPERLYETLGRLIQERRG